MPLNPFSKKKKLKKELQEQREQLFQQHRSQRLTEERLQREILEAERRLKEDRETHHKQLEDRRREQEHLERERENREEERKREQERADREREKREEEREAREELRLSRLRETSPEALRRLRDLIRTRYELDMDIWSLKGARRPDRPIVLEKMERADAVLMEIYTMVNSWEENQNMWTQQEWELAQDVKQRLLADGKRWWENNPPWNER